MSDQPSRPPKFLDQVAAAIRLRRMSYRTEQAYCDWAKRFILFHGKRHPIERGFSFSISHIPFVICHCAESRRPNGSRKNER